MQSSDERTNERQTFISWKWKFNRKHTYTHFLPMEFSSFIFSLYNEIVLVFCLTFHSWFISHFFFASYIYFFFFFDDETDLQVACIFHVRGTKHTVKWGCFCSVGMCPKLGEMTNYNCSVILSDGGNNNIHWVKIHESDLLNQKTQKINAISQSTQRALP